MSRDTSKIERVTSTSRYVEIQLGNDVVLTISSNEGYFHLSFSGVESAAASLFANDPNPVATKMNLSNFVDISYKKWPG